MENIELRDIPIEIEKDFYIRLIKKVLGLELDYIYLQIKKMIWYSETEIREICPNIKSQKLYNSFISKYLIH